MLSLVKFDFGEAEETVMTRNTVRRAGAALALTAALAAPTVVLMAPAQASGGSGVEARGTCGTGITWKLKAKHDDGRIEVEYEVDSNQVGQLWTVTLTDNNVSIFSGQRRTLAPSGSFEARVFAANRAGLDVIRARATYGSRVCSGTVSV